jgi:tight adherence protein C
MDASFYLLDAAIDEHPRLMLSMLIFLAAATLAFGVMAALRVRSSVKRRVAGVGSALTESRSLRHAGRHAAKQLIDYTSKHYSGENRHDRRALRRRLIQAGFLDPHSVAMFFLARVVAAAGFGVAAFGLMAFVDPDGGASFWLAVLLAGMLGYLAPGFSLNRRIAARQYEHRSGFPDFMDLLVVCAEAGLSIEAALDRVGRELSVSYPSLAANIYMTILELRAGRTLS